MFENFKSTQSLYGVEPCYFEKMNYFDAIKEKIELAKERIKEINSKIDYHLPDNEYRNLCKQLNECEKAKEFNIILLKEYEIKCKRNTREK